MFTEKRPIAGTIRDQAYQILKNEICTGKYLPGQWLQEKELADHLQVSRSPIREALRQLAGDGLVVEQPNKGVFVKAFTLREIEEIFDMRVMMESYALLHSKEHLTTEHKEQLLQFVSELTAAHREDNLKKYIEIDEQLHSYFILLSGNNLLVESYRRVHTMIQQFRIYSLMRHQRFDESVEEHRQMIHAIITGAVEEADEVNRKHLELAKEKIVEYLSDLWGQPTAKK
ncbi:MAG: GntR family transcriptional regulator [Angelakisella sp.]